MVRILLPELAAQGCDVELVTTDDDDRGRLYASYGDWVSHDGMRVQFFRRTVRFYTLSPSLGRWLRKHVRDYDVAHIHSVFSYPFWVGARYARKFGIPFVVRPLGGISLWGMSHGRAAFKRISLPLIEKRMLADAHAVHFTSEEEKIEASAFIGDVNTWVLPNPMPVTSTERSFRSNPGKRILFLSRIDEKKGLDMLLEALALSDLDVRLTVAGDGSQDFVESMKTRAERLGISRRVTWLGQVEGQTKEKLFEHSDLFVLPSRSENFGIAAAEAMARGVPVCVSESVPLHRLVESYEAGLVARGGAAEWARAIASALADPERLREQGSNGRKLVAQELSPSNIASDLVRLYEEIAAG